MVEVAISDPVHLSRKQHLAKTFEAYRTELDADLFDHLSQAEMQNERRERLIITSRSITQLSKKLIFHLHRGATSPPHIRLKTINEGKGKERDILASFGKIREELGSGEEGQSFWRWARPVSPGMEEYIEATSFLYYLDTGKLISLEQVQRNLSDPETGEPHVVVTPEDYILGMSDLTGELMRYATNVAREMSTEETALSTGDHETPLAVCDFVRTVKAYFDGIPPHMLYKLSKKQEETTRSLEKIEKVCYSLRLRLIEFADRPDILKQMASRALDDARGDDGGRKDGNEE